MLQGVWQLGKATIEYLHPNQKVSYLGGQGLVTSHESAFPVLLHNNNHVEKPMLPEHCFPEKHDNTLFLLLCISHAMQE